MDHGGNLHDAKALFPEAPEPWLDLSTGINPTPYPFALPGPDAFRRLPSPQQVQEVECIAARAYGVDDASRVVAAPGSQALIGLLPRLRPLGKVAVVGPTYSEHARSWTRQGHDVIPVPDIAGALATQPDVIVLVNPNNPDGRIVAAPPLIAAAAELRSRDGWLVIDEAFADLEDGVSVADRDIPGIIVLRSLGKAYGLAGIRLGFAVTWPELGLRLREELGPWAISGPALDIGAAALADGAWLSSQKSRLRESSLWLDEILTKAGFSVVGGTKLFRLARHEWAHASFEHLARKGIWVRKFGFDPTILRFGIPEEKEWSRLEAVLINQSIMPTLHVQRATWRRIWN
ncbi:threonine-phosphate decarboxylase CobD [Microvirga sp. 2TAF3]|uniref:threonine-phosphate decarboxylase CobD n=1 Tax=Microvirga sp. 2TAF3 TaxID=3233014 RepID=UPI003F9B3F97